MKRKFGGQLIICLLMFGIMAACARQGNDNGDSGASGGGDVEAYSDSSGSGSGTTASTDSGSGNGGGGTTDTPAASGDPWADIAVNLDNTDTFYNFEWAGIGMQFGGDAMADFITEKFNFDLTLTSADWATLSLRMVADTLPHQIGASFTDGYYSQLITEGYAYRLPDELLMQFPYLWDYVHEGVLTRYERERRGARYSLPSTGNPDEVGPAFGMGWQWRKDWANNLGLEEPQTMDELYEVMRAFTFDNPTGNINNITYGISGNIFTAHFAPWLDYYNWYKVDDTWIPGYLTEEMVDGIRYWNRAYNEGILDPECNLNEARPMWAQSAIGTGVFHGDGYWIWQTMHLAFGAAQYPDLDPSDPIIYDSYELIGPFTLERGQTAYWQWNPDHFNRIFDSKMSDDEIIRHLIYYNWVHSPEGRDFIAYGFEGVDWYKNDDGLAVRTLPYDEDTRAETPLWNVYQSMGALGLGERREYTESANPPMWTPLEVYYYNRDIFTPRYGKNIFDPNIDIVHMSTPAKDEWIHRESVEVKMNEIITRPADVFEQEWRAFLQTLLNVNDLQIVIDQVNVRAREMGL